MPETEVKMVHNRLNKNLIRDIDHLAVEWDVYRAEAVERLLNEALQKYRKQGPSA